MIRKKNERPVVETYIPIPDSIRNAVYKFDFTKNERKVFDYLCHQTIGYHRESVQLSNEEIGAAIIVSQGNVSKAVIRLEKKGVVIVERKGFKVPNTYTVQKDSAKWKWDYKKKEQVLCMEPEKIDGFNPKEMHQKFFSLFRGVKTVQTFDDRGRRKDMANIYHFNGDECPSGLMDNLKYLNEMGAGIFMTINETDGVGRARENITRIRAVFVDLDGAPLEPVRKYHPSLVVESSPGKYHAYWFTPDMPVAAFGAMQRNIAALLNGDPKVVDLPRVLRVPGFYHKKITVPFLSRIIGGSGSYFSYRDLVKMFPPQMRPQFSGERYVLKKVEGLNDESDFHGDYGFSGEGRNAHLISQIGGMIKRGKTWEYIVDESYKIAAACDPPLEDWETEKVLRNGRKYWQQANRGA